VDDLWATKSEDVGLSVRTISFQDFQPMWSWSTNVIDRRTDRQTTCDRKTALCTIVHRAVKRPSYQQRCLTYLDRLQRGVQRNGPCSFCLDKPADFATAGPTRTQTRIHLTAQTPVVWFAADLSWICRTTVGVRAKNCCRASQRQIHDKSTANRTNGVWAL